MTSTPKKFVRPTTRKPNEDADPVGFAGTLAAIYAQLEDAYYARLRAFLCVFLLIKLAPAVLRGMLDAVTAQRGPVGFDLRVTIYPRNARGFFRAVGELKTPVAELAAEAEPDEQSDDPEYGPPFIGLFGKRVRARRPKGGWRKPGRRR